MRSFAKSVEPQRRRRHDVRVHHDARILFGKSRDHLRKEGGQQLRISNDKLTRGGIGQEFDVPDSLPQLVECHPAAREQRAGIHRRLDAARAAIEKPRAQSMLQIGDHLRHGWLGNPELYRRLGQAARLHDREEHAQVPQAQASADVIVPVGYLDHKRLL